MPVTITAAKKLNNKVAEVVRDDGETRVGTITFVPDHVDSHGTSYGSALRIKVEGARGRPPTWPVSVIATASVVGAQAPAPVKPAAAPKATRKRTTPPVAPDDRPKLDTQANGAYVCPITGLDLDIRRGGNATVIQDPSGAKIALHESVCSEYLDDIRALIADVAKEVAAAQAPPAQPKRASNGVPAKKVPAKRVVAGKKVVKRKVTK